jgi:hypothetical protein
MTNGLLELEVRLLILRHGRRRVLETLAAVSDQSIETVEQELRRLEDKKKAKSRKRKSSEELVSSAGEQRPEIKDRLATLIVRYENRVFLPQLREVERFLNHARVTHGKLKSRAAALPKVVEALSGLSVRELENLLETSSASGESAYSRLANEIMGNRGER